MLIYLWAWSDTPSFRDKSWSGQNRTNQTALFLVLTLHGATTADVTGTDPGATTFDVPGTYPGATTADVSGTAIPHKGTSHSNYGSRDYICHVLILLGTEAYSDISHIPNA